MSFEPTATREALLLRARLYALIREFFASRDVLEVETPILSEAGNTDPNIESFRTEFSGHAAQGEQTRWLRTSPEFPLKRLVAAGIGDCYELGRVFRNGEAGRRHNPEFTMLEWYRVGFDHHALMDETAALIVAALSLVSRRVSIEKSSYRELFLAHAGVDPFATTTRELHDALADFGICTDGLSRDDWLDLVLTHRIEPVLRDDVLLIVHDFPPSKAALAKVREGTPAVAERFELMLGAVELANGYHELTDAREQRERFLADNARRRGRNLGEPPLDERLLAALEAGLPACAGVALGVDRLLMAMLGANRLDDVLAFPFDRA
ncbi:MAG TPA: EF-P lysine aminoacylase EpmA [Candidatus Saccharimonadia bacterium]|nr:EF-P lysine aminoacylase EpmA [Candidatus Saccharimonadia bacterium]